MLDQAAVATIADPQGEYEDWVELLNTTSQAIDLSGMYLSDDPSDLKKWQFPPGTPIDAGGYLLVWADEDTTDAGLHADFTLSPVAWLSVVKFLAQS